MRLERATIHDLTAVTDDQSAFWGGREMRHLHHPMYVHEFGDTALVARDGDGTIAGYLLGFVTVTGVGYVHIVGVRDTHRRRGIGGLMYGEFERLARAYGARALKAITRPSNTGSIAFHRAIGFTATETPDYSGPGEMRIVLWRELV